MPVKEGRKILFLWTRFDFSSGGLKAKGDPSLFLNQFLEFTIWFCSS